MDEAKYKAAMAAVRYALDRVQTDADFRHHMLHTQTMRLMVHAEAMDRGEYEEVVMTRRQEWLRKHESPVAQLTEARQRIERLERALEARGICPPP